jgi:glutamate synthase (NADPH/NADH) small chain
MGKITGFLEVDRLQEASEAPTNRLKHWREFVLHLTDEQAGKQHHPRLE